MNNTQESIDKRLQDILLVYASGNPFLNEYIESDFKSDPLDQIRKHVDETVTSKMLLGEQLDLCYKSINEDISTIFGTDMQEIYKCKDPTDVLLVLTKGTHSSHIRFNYYDDVTRLLNMLEQCKPEPQGGLDLTRWETLESKLKESLDKLDNAGH